MPIPAVFNQTLQITYPLDLSIRCCFISAPKIFPPIMECHSFHVRRHTRHKCDASKRNSPVVCSTPSIMNLSVRKDINTGESLVIVQAENKSLPRSTVRRKGCQVTPSTRANREGPRSDNKDTVFFAKCLQTRFVFV